MPIHMYRRISDDDARALVAYLRAQPPVKNVVPKSVYYMKLPRAYGPPIKQEVVAPPRTDRGKYGAYLAVPLGHCIDCHTPYTDKGMDMTRIAGGLTEPILAAIKLLRPSAAHLGNRGSSGW